MPIGVALEIILICPPPCRSSHYQLKKDGLRSWLSFTLTESTVRNCKLNSETTCRTKLAYHSLSDYFRNTAWRMSGQNSFMTLKTPSSAT